MVPFSFAGEDMRLVQARAIYWPREQALLVSDLHFEKASFFASKGQMLPPYDSRATLERLALAIRETQARRVYALGDNFHDGAGEARLEPYAAGMLAALTRTTDWVWVTGNHDAGMDSPVGGELVEELTINGLILRHKARGGELQSELSGHFHPRLMIKTRGRRISRHCAVMSERRLILPAFGALAGGMDAADQAIVSAMQPARAIDAILPAAGRLVQYPLWRAIP